MKRNFLILAMFGILAVEGLRFALSERTNGEVNSKTHNDQLVRLGLGGRQLAFGGDSANDQPAFPQGMLLATTDSQEANHRVFEFLKNDWSNEHFDDLLESALSNDNGFGFAMLVDSYATMSNRSKIMMLMTAGKFNSTDAQTSDFPGNFGVIKGKAWKLLVDEGRRFESTISAHALEYLFMSAQEADREVAGQIFKEFLSLSEKEIAEMYPPDQTGKAPALVWARKIHQYAQTQALNFPNSTQDILIALPYIDRLARCELLDLLRQTLIASERAGDLVIEGAMNPASIALLMNLNIECDK